MKSLESLWIDMVVAMELWQKEPAECRCKMHYDKYSPICKRQQKWTIYCKARDIYISSYRERSTVNLIEPFVVRYPDPPLEERMFN